MSFRWNGNGFAKTKPVLAAALILSAASLGVAQGAMAAGLFTGFAGKWAGEGSLKLANGASERIRCRATYEVEREGNQLLQDLRCASDSYKLTIKSDVIYKPDAGAITGSWRETGYGVGGNVTGLASSGNVQAWVRGNDFTAKVTVVTQGGQQVVTIRPQAYDVTEVAVTLRKGS